MKVMVVGGGGREHAIKLTPAVVRHHNPVCAKAHRVPRIFGIEDPLDHHRAIPKLADPFKVFPGYRGIEIVGQPADIIFKPGGFTQVGRDIA